MGTPSLEEQTKTILQNKMRDDIREQLKVWRAKTPAERAGYGLPETGWEQELFGHLGLDLSKL